MTDAPHHSAPPGSGSPNRTPGDRTPGDRTPDDRKPGDGARSALDTVLTRADGAIDLAIGRRRQGWSKLDVSADGFWNSFAAIPACLPAMLVVWLSHGRFVIENGAARSMGAAVVSLAVVEIVIWLVTIGLFVALAVPLKLADRLVPTVVAVNWASVPIAYAQAVPGAIALLAGMGPGIAFVTLIVQIIVLVGFWRVLDAALERPWPIVLGAFVLTLTVGFVLFDVGEALFGLAPRA